VGIRFTVYPAARLVAYTAEGPSSHRHARGFLAAALAHRLFEGGFDFVGDADPYTGAREPDAAYPLTLAHAVRDRADVLAPCRWAVVAPPAGLAMVRRWAELTRDSGVAVAAFAAAEDALAWLGAGTAECRALSPAP